MLRVYSIKVGTRSWRQRWQTCEAGGGTMGVEIYVRIVKIHIMVTRHRDWNSPKAQKLYCEQSFKLLNLVQARSQRL